MVARVCEGEGGREGGREEGGEKVRICMFFFVAFFLFFVL
jgi:hypothetical protein